MTESTDYAIVGGGLAGGYAAIGIRKKDMTGRIVIITNELHLPYDRVPLSKDYLLGKVQRERLFFRNKEFYDSNRIELICGHEVVSLNAMSRIVQIDDGREFAFKRLLLATGGRVRKLNLPGSELRGIYSLRTIEDCERLRDEISKAKNAVVIGGGFIGCEFASAFATKGLRTTIVEIGPYLLNMAIDEETGRWLDEYYSQKGVNVITGTSITKFVGQDGRVTAVQTNNRGEIPSDFVAVGVGIAPNTALAEQAGLKVDRGIVVNEFLETSIEGIYAAGDVAQFYSPIFGRHLRVEHYDVAVKHGSIAGTNMAGDRRSFKELPHFFSYQFDLSINAYGDLSHRTRIVRRGTPSSEKGFFQFYFNNNKLDAALAVNKPFAEIKKARELILKMREFRDPSVLSEESKNIDQF